MPTNLSINGLRIPPRLQPTRTIALPVFKASVGRLSDKALNIWDNTMVVKNPQSDAPTITAVRLPPKTSRKKPPVIKKQDSGSRCFERI